ncbi:metalloregulator ArsR/SmtB family transcription factor [Occultella kanbiaonis]|uniref:metalloregulator ArsR/SmtB family transcription factor n=1 Tax=Occultella kanbiaonis TaxID=2675754 RepID=UPI0012B9A583|nr:metalloregulator ArsR/SmtB family transcription factor [Occultella kanbiaonis]
MKTERVAEIARRAALHAALADPARLQIVDVLALGDAAPSELAELLGVGSNLLAHHLKVLEREGLVVRTRSEGDGRRWYVRLVPEALAAVQVRPVREVARVLFVCTANSARSHLATAVWRRVSTVPTASAGTHPAGRIAPGAMAAARRHGLDLPAITPQHVEAVRALGDLVVTVCDRAHEELQIPVDVHWSVPDPIGRGTPAAFDDALADLERRANALAPHLARQPG